jgi:uracil-DNA glycosylase
MNRFEVIEQVITCTRCELSAQCNGPVPLRGDPSPIAIVGEAPGETEDQAGQPFVGPAGRLLDDILDECGITEPVGICNSVSCFPHGTPTWDHIQACRPNVDAQLDYLDPIWVLLLGRVALAGFRPDIPLRRGRGRPFLDHKRICFATYHPAAALRNGSYRDCMRGDLEVFRELLDAGADNWMRFIPDSCAACPNPAEWYEDSGIGWCPVHLPARLRPVYDANQARNAAEIDAARRRDSALDAVEANADPQWMAVAFDTLVQWLRTHPTFFCDEIWDAGLDEPRESRALGAVMQRAARAGHMCKSGEFRKSVRSNMSEKPVWTSLIHGGA